MVTQTQNDYIKVSVAKVEGWVVADVEKERRLIRREEAGRSRPFVERNARTQNTAHSAGCPRCA
jgi:hypothetical protein